MSRTQGAKNNPKTVAELLAQLEKAAEREGMEFSPQLIDKTIKKVEDAATANGENAEAAVNAAREKLDKFKSLELELEDGEIDTYKCGNCGEIMAMEMANCPACGSALTW